MRNTECSAAPTFNDPSTTGSDSKFRFVFVKKSTNRLAVITLRVALISLFVFGCSTGSSSAVSANADPTVELIRTVVINTTVPQDKNSNSALPIGNAGTWLPAPEDDTDPNDLKRVTQTLVAPSFLPEHEQVARGAPKVVEVRLEVEEKLMEVGPNGAEVWGLTFNGTIPAPMIVVHQNDYVELTP
jgi:FtsP/CotA-like multicopper oxidase with cupredoxin domain